MWIAAPGAWVVVQPWIVALEAWVVVQPWIAALEVFVVLGTGLTIGLPVALEASQMVW
jgi:hypothetical protein